MIVMVRIACGRRRRRRETSQKECGEDIAAGFHGGRTGSSATCTIVLCLVGIPTFVKQQVEL